MNTIKTMKLPDNYIYISHLGEDGEYLILPSYPDTISDNMSSTFSQDTALSRSAPIYTFSNSGPRTVLFNFDLHRDLFDDINIQSSNIVLEDGEDYVDALLRKLQAIAVPAYNLSNKSVEVPTVAVKIGEEIFVKGVVTTGITVNYSKPILSNNKYANVTVGFTVSETDPYDASTISKNGSFRGLTRGMKKGFGLEVE